MSDESLEFNTDLGGSDESAATLDPSCRIVGAKSLEPRRDRRREDARTL